MKHKNKLFGLVFLLSLVSVSAFYDHATNVYDSGSLVQNGNLRVEIYQSATGGSALYDQTFTSVINNGMWSVEVNAPLVYGKTYFKDYEVNGQDIDFDGSERLAFISREGNINASNITMGNLDVARMPTGGTWTLSNILNFVGNILQIGGKQVLTTDDNTSIRAEIVSNNNSMNNYVDAQDSSLQTNISNNNNSMKSYVDASNSSMRSYVNTQDAAQDECSEITNCVPNAYDTLSDLQSSVSNDFHNLGGTDDDNPEAADVDWSDLTDNTNVGNVDVNFDSNTLVVNSTTSRVGIGTSNPSAKLDVNGNISLSGQIKGSTPSYFVQSYTSSRTATIASTGWTSYSSTSITITGDIGDVFQVYTNGYWRQDPNSGYNHDRLYPTSGCTLLVDGQESAYTTSVASTLSSPIISLVKLTGTTCVVAMQHYASSATGTSTIVAGVGSSADAPFTITAIKLH